MMRRDQEGEQKRSVIAEYTSRGEEYHHAGDLKKAIENYSAAYKIAREISDDNIERICALNLGAAYIGADEPKEGLKYLDKARPPLEKERDEPSNGALYFNQGLGFEKMGDNKKALEKFWNAYLEYRDFERYNKAVLIHCLEKCLKIHEQQKQHLKAADICKELADVFDGLSRASKLCERVTHLRLGNSKDESWKEANELLQSIEAMELEGEECLQAGKILNDLGLAFTLVNKYGDATSCFEKAVHRIQCSHIPQDQLEAVVLQNLGAAYNFMGDFQRAVKFHEDAIEKYGKSTNRNSQGQCFTNLAYALTQCGNLREAELAFHHAFQAAKDSSDQHMEWQALEGLGAVNFGQGNFKSAVDFYMKALQTVGSHQSASERIKNKLLLATQQLHRSDGSRHNTLVHDTGRTLINHTQMTNRNDLFEEHAQVVPTPRETITYEGTIVEESVEAPVMASLQEESVQKRRFVPVRKKGSIGPHYPKMSRGLASSMGFHDSPRMSLHQATQPMLEEDSEESSSDDTSSSDDSSSESDVGNGQEEVDNLRQSQKVEEIFRKPVNTMRETSEEVPLHSQYQAHLQDKEQNEGSDSDSSEDSDDSDSSDDDDDEDDAPIKSTTNAPPALPTQSPPNTALPSGTYLQPRIVQTTADVHQSVSSSRVARQQTSEQTSGGSPRERGATSDEEEDESGDESKDIYSTVDKTQQLQSRQGATDAGNRRRKSSSDGRKGENFFDSDSSSLHTSRQGEETRAEQEDPYNSLKFEREEEAGGSREVERIDDLPRGQKERILAEYHQQHERGQSHDPPPLPQRANGKGDKGESKTCNIM